MVGLKNGFQLGPLALTNPWVPWKEPWRKRGFIPQTTNHNQFTTQKRQLVFQIEDKHLNSLEWIHIDSFRYTYAFQSIYICHPHLICPKYVSGCFPDILGQHFYSRGYYIGKLFQSDIIYTHVHWWSLLFNMGMLNGSHTQINIICMYVYIFIHTCYVIIKHEHVQLNMIPKMHTVRNLNETPQVICHNSRLPDVGLSENSMSHNMLIPVYTQMLRDI